ncbi:MAG: class 1 fructose-bisphosphatase, partial [Gammaproteobacteria bacterium]
YPADTRPATRNGRLRLLYEVNPFALLVEQAGGRASNGRGPVLQMVPGELHERAPVILGSREEVERIERYHQEYDAGIDKPFVSPLFNERSLFRAEA